MRTQWAPKLALAFFAVGLVLVGVYTAIWVHYSESLFRNFRRDVSRFLQKEITWEAMTGDDATRADKTTWLYVVGYGAFGCFAAGAAIGLLCSSF
jgi:hypothetical protein